MEIIVFFPLLLLVCSVSADQTEVAKETLGKQISLQQLCQQDIHAVLIELSVALAEQKIEIRTLKQDNQDHTTKLERQKAELERQKTEVERQKADMEQQKTEIDQLKQQSKVKQVAFSASLLDGGSGYTGPFNTQITLIFKRVVTNIGNAYNPHTGIFTAPVKGAYHFEWHLHGHAHSSYPIAGVLFRNGEHIFLAYEWHSSGTLSPSGGASLLLEPGDQVSLRLWANARIFDGANHDTNFGGHLLFTM